MNSKNFSETKDLVELFRVASQLKKVKRAGWVRIGIKNPESVADHSYVTAVMAMILGQKLGLNQNKLLKLSLIHDMAEAKVGDLVADGTSSNISFVKKAKLENAAVLKMFETIGARKEYLALWKEFEQQKTKESVLVREIDKLEMAFTALEYEKDGYKKETLNEFWETTRKYVKNKELKKIFTELEKKRSTFN